MSLPLIQRSAADLAKALAAGETTSVELTQAFLDRIVEVDTAADGRGIHAFLHVDSEGALAAGGFAVLNVALSIDGVSWLGAAPLFTDAT